MSHLRCIVCFVYAGKCHYATHMNTYECRHELKKHKYSQGCVQRDPEIENFFQINLITIVSE